MAAIEKTMVIEGEVGKIEILEEIPASGVQGIALVAHPHPLFGGTNTNKVVQTLAKSFVAAGFSTYRPNFRGVGKSAGVHDHGVGEAEDLRSVLAYAQAHLGDLPVILSGFSFGAYVITQLLRKLDGASDTGVFSPLQACILVGTAAGLVEGARAYTPADIHPAHRPKTRLIHGAKDEIVPLDAVLAWAAPQDLTLSVLPDGEHFFHGKLAILRHLLTEYLR